MYNKRVNDESRFNVKRVKENKQNLDRASAGNGATTPIERTSGQPGNRRPDMPFETANLMLHRTKQHEILTDFDRKTIPAPVDSDRRRDHQDRPKLLNPALYCVSLLTLWHAQMSGVLVACRKCKILTKDEKRNSSVSRPSPEISAC